MSQHDMVVDNASGATFRADVNAAFQALVSTSKGPSAPATPYAGQLWVDDNTPSSSVWTLFQYDGSDWISLGLVDTTNNRFRATYEPYLQAIEATPYATYSSSSSLWAAGDNALQNTEGAEILSASITPSNASNRLLIEVVAHIAPSASTVVVAGIFQDAIASALAMGYHGSGITDDLQSVFFSHEMAAGTTSPTTFKVRVAAAAGSVLVNGVTAGRRGGGKLACRLRITEIQV